MTPQPQFPNEHTESGEFQRQEDAFRQWVTDDGRSGFPAAAGRYHLYVSSCLSLGPIARSLSAHSNSWSRSSA